TCLRRDGLTATRVQHANRHHPPSEPKIDHPLAPIGPCALLCHAVTFMEDRKPLLPAGVGTAPSTFRKGSYLVTLLGATRPHFFAFPVGAAYAGVAATGRPLTFFTLAQLGLIAGGGWGVGQLLNDILDHQADALDAPHRPVVR